MFIANAQAKERPAPSKPLTVAVASNFYYPLTQLLANAPQWQAEEIRLVSGSSGVLFAQIINGAPYDVFLSADAKRPMTLHQRGFGPAPISYAIGELVIWPASVDRSIMQNLLETEGRIAVANPQTAPFGSAALAYLKSIPEYLQLESKLVFGNNIAQAFQFVDTGNASVGFIAKSMLVQARLKFPNKHEQYSAFLPVNDKDYPEIVQQGIVLGNAERSEHPMSSKFIAFLLLEDTQEQLVNLGYKRVAQ